MATDRQLSANFWLHEFPCYQKATEAQVGRLKETVQRVLQPFRNYIGRPVVPTSWMWWSSGCVPRVKSHNPGGGLGGGTTDFDAPDLSDTDFRSAFSWGVTNLLPAGYLGRWILEPRMVDPDTGEKVQGRHIHAAPRDDMLAANLPGDIGAFLETSPGSYIPAAGAGDHGATWGGHTGAYGDPIPLEGIVATVGFNWSRWLALGVVAGILLEERKGRRRTG